ncbi:hypothetical protein [Christiangramia salexigens]|uniref:Membrane metalloprotease n=1 Tax=Christiangramia salexigens TaxID=1913577 RepID=A0A1L3J4N0_9FLAO|nr:hypothetical protein [Christiangramia salexigens]APG60081.1 hypothetical protein LPB144_06475 [Christiangramia salexigens]
MNIKKFFTLVFSIVVLISCSKEDSTNPRNGGIDKSANLKALGTSATELLSDVSFTSMNIEIAYVEGNRPADEAINIFRNFLEARTHKPDGIRINLRAVSSSGQAPFTIDEIVQIEKSERTAYNAGDEIAVWIYFADGSNEKDTNEKFVLGSAFRNTSMVIYEKTIKDFANRTGAPSRAIIEAATLNHEFGHLFGLVDLGTTPVSDHEDPNNEGHCVSDNCLMRASIEFGGGVVDVINGSEVPKLDEACRNDLISVGGK